MHIFEKVQIQRISVLHCTLESMGCLAMKEYQTIT